MMPITQECKAAKRLTKLNSNVDASSQFADLWRHLYFIINVALDSDIDWKCEIYITWNVHSSADTTEKHTENLEWVYITMESIEILSPI